MNSFITDSELPEEATNFKWGNQVLKNFIKNVGIKIQTLHLDLPLSFNMQEICEYILNCDDCSILSDLRITGKDKGQ